MDLTFTFLQLYFFSKIMWVIFYFFTYSFDESLRVLICPDLVTIRLFAMLFSKKLRVRQCMQSSAVVTAVT